MCVCYNFKYCLSTHVNTEIAFLNNILSKQITCNLQKSHLIVKRFSKINV